MHKLSTMMFKFRQISVAKPSSHPTVTDSLRIEPELFEEDEPQAKKAYVPVVTNVVVKHSAVFNSQRLGGMSSLEQLQFVQMLKGVIVEEAPMIFGGTKDFKITAMRRAKQKPEGAPRSLGEEMEHVATLVTGSPSEWTVLLMGDGTEYLVDAVENLWEKVLLMAGGQRTKLNVGDELSFVETGRTGTGTTLAAKV